jgi:MFS family permease
MSLTTAAALLGRLATGLVVDRLDRRRVAYGAALAAGAALEALAAVVILLRPRATAS